MLDFGWATDEPLMGDEKTMSEAEYGICLCSSTGVWDVNAPFETTSGGTVLPSGCHLLDGFIQVGRWDLKLAHHYEPLANIY
jgi:hypothetical protein